MTSCLPRLAAVLAGLSLIAALPQPGRTQGIYGPATITSGTINGTAIGDKVPGPGTFTTVTGGGTLRVVDVTAPPYGISASAPDNTTALQAAVNAAIAAGKTLYIPAAAPGSCYKYIPPLTIAGNLDIAGDLVTENWQSGINIPLGNPALFGSVLCPTSNGQNAINITGTSRGVSIRNLGILFQTPYVGTGDGINYTPGVLGGGFNQGLSGSIWNNVKVFGTDGNHYAYNLTNFIYDTFIDLYGYGGGGFNLFGSPGNYGNSVFIHPYSQVYVGGTGYGFKITAGGVSNLNLLTFIRPQAIVENSTGANNPPSPTPVTNAQYVFFQDGNSATVRLISPDFESTVSAPVQLVYNNGNSYDYDQSMASISDVVMQWIGTPQKQAIFGTGTRVAGGFFAGAVSGTVTFDQAFPNGIYAVVCTGWGHTCQINGAPTTTGFPYAQSGAGTSYYIAYGW